MISEDELVPDANPLRPRLLRRTHGHGRSRPVPTFQLARPRRAGDEAREGAAGPLRQGQERQAEPRRDRRFDEATFARLDTNKDGAARRRRAGGVAGRAVGPGADGAPGRAAAEATAGRPAEGDRGPTAAPVGRRGGAVARQGLAAGRGDARPGRRHGPHARHRPDRRARRQPVAASSATAASATSTSSSSSRP